MTVIRSIYGGKGAVTTLISGADNVACVSAHRNN